MILAKIIKNKSQLLKFVYEQKQEDKRDLPLYVLNNIDKSFKLSNARNNDEKQCYTRGFFSCNFRVPCKRKGKHRNILIIGPANCGKIFMLNPLCVSAPKNHSPGDVLLEKTCRYLLHPFLKSENTKTTLLMNKKVK